MLWKDITKAALRNLVIPLAKMKSSILLVLLFVAFSSTFQTISSDNLQHQEDKKQRVVKEHRDNQQRKIAEFLSAFDKVQKSTKAKLFPKTTDLQVYTKMFGKTIKMEEFDDSQSMPPISHEEAIVDFLEIYPLSGKNFRKATPLSSKKSKKRACFWKYCVQSK
ncbi:uncharacterized protein LOC143840696 isoform X2 [Paroedura picta]|uniref:uncharacterized protein LOC143840696 isoform X2 n=1 Tax=Paroedura picta TaxID=143630 RepID=UPI00405620B5